MNIAFFTPKMIIGGAETYIYTKARWLVDRGHNVFIFSEGGIGLASLPANVIHITITNFGMSPLIFSEGGYLEFIREVTYHAVKNKIDVIEAHNNYPAIHASFVFCHTQIPFIINILHECGIDRNPLLLKLLNNIRTNKLLYTLTATMRDYMLTKRGANFDFDLIPIPIEGYEISKYDNNNPYILSVCRLSDDKMYVKYLIQAFGELADTDSRLKNFSLKIVGEGKNFDLISQMALEINNKLGAQKVKILGTVVGEKLDNLLKDCYSYVGMGTTLLLAVSAGKSSLIAGITPEAQPYSWGIWGQDPSDKEIIGITETSRVHVSYKDALLSLLDPEKNEENGIIARKLFLQNYDINTIMEKWEIIYSNTPTIYKNMSTKDKARLDISVYTKSLRFLRSLYKIFKR